MAWTDILKTVAPTVISALGSPLAGAAIAALGSLFGVEEPTQEKLKDIIEKGQLTPEMIVKLKELELDYKAREQELGFKYEELKFKDVDSARNREIQVKDNTNKVLAYAMILGFLATTSCVLMGWANVDSVLAGTLIGYVSAKAEQVLSYYFGNSKANEHTTNLLSQADAIRK